MDCRSPSPASSLPVKDEDYWRQLSGPTQDEDWSTVDKKKDRKGKAVPKQADATAALATTTSNWDTADDDGWEDAGNLLDPEPGPPGLQPQPDASASTSDQNGHQPAVPTGRSDSDVQCDKCGKWGHPASKCTEEFCDRCQQKGHSIKNCKQRHQRGEGAKRASEDRAREARLADSQRDANIQCHRCGQYGHRIANCHIPDSRGAQQCFNCQQLGHTAGGCTNPPVPRATPKTAILVKTAPLTTSRRHADVKASQSTGASQAGPTDQEEQQRGRGKGRGSRDQPADGSNTLPLTKPGRYKITVLSCICVRRQWALLSCNHALLDAVCQTGVLQLPLWSWVSMAMCPASQHNAKCVAVLAVCYMQLHLET